jgi:transcriptional regulator with GAF, ATPase, and Fis domain
VFYRIAERAAADLSFYDFLQSVHGLLGELLYAKNCYVCLYDAQKQRKNFPYYVDERDGDALQRSDVPYRRGLTEFVLSTGRPQIIDAARLKALEAGGQVTEGSGDMTFSSWLGVPMHIRGAIGGVLAVQGYEPGVQVQRLGCRHPLLRRQPRQQRHRALPGARRTAQIGRALPHGD